MTKGEIAKQNFFSGLNCSQAVLMAFCEDFGIDKNSALMMSASFGGGMGRLREVCGTVSGMFMVLGIAENCNNPSDKSAKTKLYGDVQHLAEKFKEANGSIICRDLLNLRIKGKDTPTPSDRTDDYYKARPCPELCRFSADLLDEFLKENNLYRSVEK